MPEATIVLEVEDPNFAIRLHGDILKIDLKGGLKNELEEALENKPVLKETVGKVLGIFVPLHLHVGDIDPVHIGSKWENQIRTLLSSKYPCRFGRRRRR